MAIVPVVVNAHQPEHFSSGQVKMHGELEIRPFQEGDRQAILDITRRAFEPVSVDAAIERRYGLLNGTDWQQRKQTDVSGDLDGNPGGCFVACEGGRVIGYITTTINREAAVGRIPNLAVDPDCHGRGCGKALLRQAFAYFRQQGMELYRIETTENNATGRALYPRFGFREIARQIVYAMRAAEATELAQAENDRLGQE